MSTYYNDCDCNNCIEDKNSIFNILTEEEKNILKNNLTCITYKRNETIFKEGFKPTGLIYLAKGQAKLCKEGIGHREQIIRLVKTGEFLGYRALFADEYYNASAIALEESTVCIIDKKALYEVMSRNCGFDMKIIKMLADELGQSESRTVSLTQKYLRGRLAESLLLLIQTFGYEEDNQTIKVRMSREDLASLSNMTTSNAIRTLYSFVHEGVIELEGKKIKVLDVHKLEQISNMG